MARANAQTLAGDTQTTRFEFPAAMLRAADLKLAGQVLGPDNKPVSGANVNVQPIEGQPIANTTTDAQGHFAFAAVCEGTVRLSANTQGGPNYMYANAQAQAGDTNALIRLLANGQAMPANARMVTTSGTVFDPDGTPVSGVRLSVMPAFGMNAEVRSDAAGKYSITWQARIAGARAGAAAPGGAAAIPAIQYLLLARDQEHRLASAVDLDEKATNVDVHLQAALTISGFVIDPGGAPVTNAMIGILLRAGNNASSILLQQPVTVDALGAFSITPLPQSQRYTLTAKATGYGTDTRRLAAAETETTSLQLPPFTLKVANLKLQGRVVDADDKPVSGARVSVIGTGQPVDTTTTDSNGHFLCQHVCEGPLQVFASGQPAINGSASVQAQGGDMDVVVKVGVDATGSRIIRQAAPRTAPLKPPPWSWTAFSQWPAQHPKVMVVLLGAQVTALLGTAGGLFWLARKRRV
jgi:protocatechuate 3,4-dioxygenase beta subunit